MPVPNNITDLDTDPINNSPPGTESAKGNIDNYLRTAFAFIKQIYNSVVANDTAAVHKTGNESIAGNKTFTDDIIMSGASFYGAEGAAVASVAGAIDIWIGDGNARHITGNLGPITSLGTAPFVGATQWLICDGTPTFAQGANLDMNAGGADYVAQVGDILLVYADTVTQMDVLVFSKSGVLPTGMAFSSAASYTAATVFTAANAGKLLYLNTASNFAQTLPALSAVAVGATLFFSNVGNGIQTITRAGADVITGVNLTGATSFPMNKGDIVGLTKLDSATWAISFCNSKFLGTAPVWVDVSGSRSLGGGNTNTSGRPRQVNFSAFGGASATLITPTVNGVALADSVCQNGASFTIANLSFEVPIGASYSISPSGGSGVSSFKWLEK